MSPKKQTNVKRGVGLAIFLSAAAIVGCVGLQSSNFFAPLDENTNFSVVFVNETPYNVSTYWGVYNPLDLHHGVTIRRVELGPNENSAQPEQVPNSRRLDVAGANLRNAARVAQISGLDPAVIPDEIAFLNPADNTTVGTAPAAEFLLGPDYPQKSFVEIHFKPVPDTTDQFTVELFALAPTPIPTVGP